MSFGSKTTNVSQPESQSASETTRQAIQAQLDTGPQLAAQEFQLAQEYSPQYAQLQTQLQQQYGEELGKSYYDMVAASNPYVSAVEEATAGKILERLGQSDEDLLDEYRREFAAAEAGAGRLGAPVGSFNMARQTVGARDDIMRARISEGLSLGGKTPVTGAQPMNTVNPTTTSPYVQSFLGYNQGIYGTNANMFNQSQSNQIAQRGQNMQLIGAGVGALGTVGGGFFGA